MADIDDVAIAVAPAGKLHLALSDGNHRRSGRSRVVDRQVRSDSTKDWMESSGAEGRRNARVTQWCTHERTPQRVAIAIVVAAGSVTVYEIIGGIWVILS